MSKLFRFTYEGVLEAEDQEEANKKVRQIIDTGSGVKYSKLNQDFRKDFRENVITEKLLEETQLDDEDWMFGIPLGCDNDREDVSEILSQNSSDNQDFISELKELIEKYESST